MPDRWLSFVKGKEGEDLRSTRHRVGEVMPVFESCSRCGIFYHVSSMLDAPELKGAAEIHILICEDLKEDEESE